MSDATSTKAAPGAGIRMNRKNIADFVRQVRQETAKVTWPSRKETMITGGLVMLMSVVAAIFFVVVDFVLGRAVHWILTLGG